MSHFTVLVITDSPEEVESVLQPYHEYECTGVEDEYVVDVDRTEEVEKHLNSKVFGGYNKESGKKDYEYNEDRAQEKLSDYTSMTWKFYYKFAGLSQDNEIREYFGYEFKDGKWIDHTNPNKKWDWWVIGGRWSGMLLAKDPSRSTKGQPGLMGAHFSDRGVDQCQMDNLDLEGMSELRKQRRTETWEAYEEDTEKNPQMKQFLYGIKEGTTKEEYINTDSGFSTFAVVKDGQWYERGQMGWWAVVTDEKDEDEWDQEMRKLLKDLPGDKWLTIVDCHI